MAHCDLASYSELDLNDMARDIRRPSTSGKATFIAMSLGPRPIDDSNQVFFSLLDRITWNTGQSVFLKGLFLLYAPIDDTAKAVVFNTAPTSTIKLNTLINSSE